jgi:hypothetical protein
VRVGDPVSQQLNQPPDWTDLTLKPNVSVYLHSFLHPEDRYSGEGRNDQ